MQKEDFLSTGVVHPSYHQMIVSFLFHLLFILEIVISGSIESIPHDKNNNEIKGKDILPPLNNNTIKPKTLLHDISDDNKDVLIKSDSHNTLAPTDKSKESNLVIPEGIKDDPLLVEIFKGVPKTIPTTLIPIIGDYIKYHDDTINEYYERIKKELMSTTGKTILNLYHSNFISHLLNLVRDGI